MNVLDEKSSVDGNPIMRIRRITPGQKFVAIAALLVVVSIGVALTAHRQIAAAWSQATAPQSEYYTSLAFLNTGHLPTYASAGKIQSISFRITNHESVTTIYQYHISLNTGSTATLLKEGSVTLNDSQSADQTLQFSLPRPNMIGQIMVQLVNRPEYITFEVKS